MWRARARFARPGPHLSSSWGPPAECENFSEFGTSLIFAPGTRGIRIISKLSTFTKLQINGSHGRHGTQAKPQYATFLKIVDINVTIIGRLGGQLVFVPKIFSALLTRDIGNIGIFAEQKKNQTNGAAGEKKLGYSVKIYLFTAHSHTPNPFLRSKKGKMAPQAKKN